MTKGNHKCARKATPSAGISLDGHNDTGGVSCSLCEAIIDDDNEIQCK